VIDDRPDVQAGSVGTAVRDGLAEGFRQHLPDAVGIALKGSLLCVLAAFVHFVLDVGVTPTLLGAVAGGAGLGGAAVLRGSRRKTDDDSSDEMDAPYDPDVDARK